MRTRRYRKARYRMCAWPCFSISGGQTSRKELEPSAPFPASELNERNGVSVVASIVSVVTSKCTSLGLKKSLLLLYFALTFHEPFQSIQRKRSTYLGQPHNSNAHGTNRDRSSRLPSLRSRESHSILIDYLPPKMN